MRIGCQGPDHTISPSENNECCSSAGFSLRIRQRPGTAAFLVYFQKQPPRGKEGTSGNHHEDNGDLLDNEPDKFRARVRLKKGSVRV